MSSIVRTTYTVRELGWELRFVRQARMMSREPEYDVQAAGTDIDFLQQPGRYWADFSGPERTLL
jgi:hypothetical protein